MPTGGLFLDGVGRLLLGADEEDGLAVLSQLSDEVVGFLELLDGFLKVNDVDAVALTVDVLGHLGVPAAGLVTEVDTGLEQLLHGYDCHLVFSFFIFVISSGGLILSAKP